MCIYNENRLLVWVNGKMIPFNDCTQIFFNFTTDEFVKKCKIMEKDLIERNKKKKLCDECKDCIFFAIYMPETDPFWIEYMKLRNTKDKARYIVREIGFTMEVGNSPHTYIMFYNDGEGYFPFTHRNEIKMLVVN